ncbi:hypothetical protein EJV47_00090 [Hymenobacter gummosus]|uniref:DUF4783 domain-containing protein n=1 Tax=Hymenobacter gummosus TaxID=1776032 RepID=A0A431U834_9BACT|nr:hypothetical protein [Hymenobacter gummosus]RTQ53177.1 hypothetical protein EJV47_00090 [Hymenobacter gummosus]
MNYHWLRRLLPLLLLGLLWLPASAGPPAQAFLARQFLLAVLQGRFGVAYELLAPETRQQLSRQQFRQAAAPLYQRGQQAGPSIELYRLGLRLGENDDARWFYAFTFRSDSAAAAPAQLDVTFRDSAATQVLEFRLVPGKVK